MIKSMKQEKEIHIKCFACKTFCFCEMNTTGYAGSSKKLKAMRRGFKNKNSIDIMKAGSQPQKKSMEVSKWTIIV